MTDNIFLLLIIFFITDSSYQSSNNSEIFETNATTIHSTEKIFSTSTIEPSTTTNIPSTQNLETILTSFVNQIETTTALIPTTIITEGNLTKSLEVFNSTIKPSDNKRGVTVLKVACDVNQELKTCGSSCPKTCLLQNPSCEEHCIKDICQCKDGYVVSSNGTCVLPSECSPLETKKCPKNSHLVACGSPCAPTCEIPQPTVCALQCIVDACECNEGYVLNKNQECIPLTECPKQKICSTNERFFSCGTKCEPSCKEPFPGFCSDQCLENACQCDVGFVRNNEGKCVELTDCPL